MEENTLFGKSLVSIRAKTKEKNTVLNRALGRIRAKIEKNTLCGKALVRIKDKIEKHPKNKGKNRKKTLFRKAFG